MTAKSLKGMQEKKFQKLYEGLRVYMCDRKASLLSSLGPNNETRAQLRLINELLDRDSKFRFELGV